MNKLSNALKMDSESHGHSEGRVTKMIEAKTTKIPSGGFLALALGFMGLSALLQFTSGASKNGKTIGSFVGLWAPTVLILGLYNKLTKLEGSEKKKAA